MTDSSADRDPLDRLAEEFVARLRRGEHPAVSEYAGRHPELADQVRELFPALVEMEQLKPAAGELTGAYGSAAEPGDPARVGEFRILRRVGHGGMGVVYEAVQESLGRHVALKLLPAEAVADPKRLERFRREARAAARLHHTNIVPVFGVGEADGRHYYAMQFIPGHPLDAVITEVRRLKENSLALPAAPRAVSEVAGSLMSGTFASASAAAAPVGSSPSLSGTVSGGGSGYWATVARVGAQVADALAYAHGQGVLHRDVKPANLLLDPSGTVWVTDFGLAKSADADDLTHAGDIVGTLRYMAPERFDGAGDARADVYALGLTLYELLTLRPAFASENRAKLVQEVTAANPPRPRAVTPTVPRDLETIVLKATARDPAARYQTAAALGDDLRRFLDGRTISARRAGPAEQAWRWAKRNPAVAALLAAVVLVSVVGAAVSTVFALRADADRTTALAREQDADEAKDRALARERDAVAARKDADDRAKALAAEQEQTGYLLHVSRLGHAQEAAQEYRSTRLRELLGEMTPKVGGRDLRGWEWHHLDRLAHPWDAEAKLTPTAWAPDDKELLLSSSLPASVITPDGARLIVPPVPSSATNLRAGLGPSDRRTGVVYDIAAGGPPVAQFDAFPPGARIFRPVVGPDAKVVVGLPALLADRLIVWDTVADRELAAWSVQRNPVIQVAPGGNRVAVVSEPGRTGFEPPGTPTPTGPARLDVWERGHDGPKSWPFPKGVESQGSAPGWYFAPDATTLLKRVLRPNPKGEDATTFEFWDVAGEPRLRKSTTVRRNFMGSVGFSAGGAAVVVVDGVNSESVAVFETRTGEPLGTLTVPRPDVGPGSRSGVLAVTASDDGRRVAAVLTNGVIVVGQREDTGPPAAAGEWRVVRLRGPALGSGGSARDAVRLRLTDDGSRLVITTGDRAAYTWNLRPLPGDAATWPARLSADGPALFPFPVGRGGRVLYIPLLFTPGSWDGRPKKVAVSVIEYDPGLGTVVSRKTVAIGQSEPGDVSPDGRRLLVHTDIPPDAPPGGGKGPRSAPTRVELLALDRPDTPVLRTIDLGDVGTIITRGSSRADFSDGGRWVVTPVFTSPVKGTTFRPLLTSGYRFWSADTGEPGASIPADPAAWGDAGRPVLSPDDRRVLVVTTRPVLGDATRTVRAFDPATGKEQWAWEVPPLPPPLGQSKGLARQPWPVVRFAPDGRHAAVATRRTVYLLDAATGAVARTLPFEPGPPAQAVEKQIPELIQGSNDFLPVAFGPTGMLMVGTGRDAVLWDGTGAAGRRLSGHDGMVMAGAFTADGRRVFTYDRGVGLAASADTLRVWDAATGQPLLTLATLPAPVGFVGRGTGAVPRLWVEGDRLHVMTSDGVRVFDGSPRGK